MEALSRLPLDQSMLLAASSLPLFRRHLPSSLRPSLLSNCRCPVQKHSVLVYWPKMLRQPCLSPFNPKPLSAHTWFAYTLLNGHRHTSKVGVLRSRRAGIDRVALLWAGGSLGACVAEAAGDAGLGVAAGRPAAWRAGGAGVAGAPATAVAYRRNIHSKVIIGSSQCVENAPLSTQVTVH